MSVLVLSILLMATVMCFLVFYNFYRKLTKENECYYKALKNISYDAYGEFCPPTVDGKILINGVEYHTICEKRAATEEECAKCVMNYYIKNAR